MYETTVAIKIQGIRYVEDLLLMKFDISERLNVRENITYKQVCRILDKLLFFILLLLIIINNY